MIEKLECTCIKAYKTRNMRDPNCCACSCDHNDLVEQLAKANERVAELEQNQLPIESGENRYGLDVSYFRNVINRELNRSLGNYKPDELARVLARISRTADKSVMFEPEFSKKFAIEKKIEALGEIKDKWIKKASEMPLGLECRSKGSSCYNWAMYYAKELTDEVEQLRKEQE
jgi:hypothetical protein